MTVCFERFVIVIMGIETHVSVYGDLSETFLVLNTADSYCMTLVKRKTQRKWHILWISVKPKLYRDQLFPSTWAVRSERVLCKMAARTRVTVEHIWFHSTHAPGPTAIRVTDKSSCMPKWNVLYTHTDTYGYPNSTLQNVTLWHPQNIQSCIRHMGLDRPKAVNKIYLLTAYLIPKCKLSHWLLLSIKQAPRFGISISPITTDVTALPWI